MKANLEQFLLELEELSKKHGVWIVSQLEDRDLVSLVNTNFELIAIGLHNEIEGQRYMVEKRLSVGQLNEE